ADRDDFESDDDDVASSIDAERGRKAFEGPRPPDARERKVRALLVGACAAVLLLVAFAGALFRRRRP
ncbi:MAG TPA: hypothetical protein VEI02_10110, partial [Planctomycetota bacterium]|nr:hypothetical protein [Planctomycetota bacterium]